MEVHNVGGSRCRHPSNRGNRVAAALYLAPVPLPTRHVESRQNVRRKRVSSSEVFGYMHMALHICDCDNAKMWVKCIYVLIHIKK